MIRHYAVACAALITLPTLALGEEPKPKAKTPPKICRSEDTSGSRIANRVCKTQAQWEEDERENDITNGDYETRGNRVVTSRILNTGTGGTGPGTGAPN